VLAAVPTSVVTTIEPDDASVSITAWITVSAIAPRSADPVPPNATLTVLARWLPWISTSWPDRPESGENEVISGSSPTKKSWSLVPVPSAVVTAIGPVTAPTGTVVWIEPNVDEITEATAPPMHLGRRGEPRTGDRDRIADAAAKRREAEYCRRAGLRLLLKGPDLRAVVRAVPAAVCDHLWCTRAIGQHGRPERRRGGLRERVLRPRARVLEIQAPDVVHTESAVGSAKEHEFAAARDEGSGGKVSRGGQVAGRQELLPRGRRRQRQHPDVVRQRAVAPTSRRDYELIADVVVDRDRGPASAGT
jgi:hypothetical protein